MAYENINIYNRNFCIGPQTGTICTIDLSAPRTVMKVKNMTGATIMSLTLSANIITTNVRIEYVGPKNLNSMVSGLVFFTFEKVSDSVCVIKRWETRLSYMEMMLKEEVVKYSTGDVRFNAIDFAVEYHHKTFIKPNESYNFLHIDDTAYIKNGTKLILGPSTDASNIGAMETVSVSSIAYDIDGYKIGLSSHIENEYSIGDPITFYNNVYIYSSDGYGGDDSKGTLLKLDAYNWNVIETDTKALYKRVTASRWCSQIECVASVVDTNMFFVQPYNSYNNWRSMFMNNIEGDEYTTFPIFDVIFDNYTVYKLQKKISLRGASGGRSIYNWTLYNYHQDTIMPYTNSLSINLSNSTVVGYSKTVVVNCQVRDQFHTGLRDKVVTFTKAGDTNSAFDPLNGVITSDINGLSSINYISGFNFTGRTIISAQASGSSPFTGSQYVYSENGVTSIISITDQSVHIEHPKTVESVTNSSQIDLGFKILIPGETKKVLPEFSIFCKSFFTYPGGDWGNNLDLAPGVWEPIQEVKKWLPMLYLGDDLQVDTPAAGPGKGFTDSSEETSFDILSQVKSFDIGIGVKSLLDFMNYSNVKDIGERPRVSITHPDESGDVQFSQLKTGLHSHWVDGVYYDSLWTYVKTNQFVFVEEAIPQFWSEKNAVDTNIWIRLRPFAFSLNASSLKFYVREVSYLGDSGYIDMNYCTQLSTFSAGSSLTGIEATCNPPNQFLHNSRIFVRIEVKDIASVPNFIYTEYWFDVIPDYKAPYLTNLIPDREANNVSTISTVHFEIMDNGSGIDIGSLECFLNSRIMLTDFLIIEEVSRFHYKVTYTPPEPLYFNKPYKVTIKVNDISEYKNRLNDSYRFYTLPSEGVEIIDMTPSPCKRGMERFEDVSAKLLAWENGIDVSTLRVQVFNRDIDPLVLPIIYRIG